MPPHGSIGNMRLRDEKNLDFLRRVFVGRLAIGRDKNRLKGKPRLFVEAELFFYFFYARAR